MTETDLLVDICALCKASVHVTVNQHRSYYEPLRLYLTSPSERHLDIAPEVMAKMLELDTIVEVQCYPDTPVGCYYVAHWDLQAALQKMLDILKETK